VNSNCKTFVPLTSKNFASGAVYKRKESASPEFYVNRISHGDLRRMHVAVVYSKARGNKTDVYGTDGVLHL
jgi:hypothetical protein